MYASAEDQANQQMVDRLIAWGALWSPPLCAAFRATPRHLFLDRVFQYQRKRQRWQEVVTRDPGPDELRILYADRALITRLSPATPSSPAVPISSSSQPSLMAQMLEDLRPAAGQRVLEVGAGTGYNAALLAQVVGADRVVSVDVDRQVLAEAWDHLRAFAERGVRLQHADGRCGWSEAAPYDRIMVTAATPDLEPAWLEQLRPGGLLLAPLALAPGLAFIVRGTVIEGVFHGRLTRAAYFMPLRSEDEGGEGDAETVPAGGPLRTLPAPWADWFNHKRPRVGWFGFIQSLAFFAWLRGLEVSYQAVGETQPTFGVHAASGEVCWLGAQSWLVHDDAGRDLGRHLWRDFLDAGGPWPTEFALRAGACHELSPAGGQGRFVRQGPRCQQVWELIEPRERSNWI